MKHDCKYLSKIQINYLKIKIKNTCGSERKNLLEIKIHVKHEKFRFYIMVITEKKNQLINKIKKNIYSVDKL